MSVDVDIYFTNEAIENAVVYSATTSVSQVRETVLNNNLNTYYEGTAGSMDIVVDCTKAYNIDSFGFWIENYNNDFSALTVSCSGSSDAVTWESGSSTTINNNEGNGLFYHYANESYNYRYFKFNFSSMAGLNISRLFLMKKHEIRNYESSFAIKPEFFNDKVELLEHNQYPAAYKNKVTSYKLSYDLTNTAMIDDAVEIFDESKGRLIDFIYQPDDMDTAVLCNFDKDTPKWSQTHQSLWSATFEFTTVPYILTGEIT